MRNKVGNRTNLFATDVQLQSSLSVAEFACSLHPASASSHKCGVECKYRIQIEEQLCSKY